ncbi:JmjC domain, hydroxylase-domain-containing protein [Schizophyllum fasciatum]
MEEFQDFERYMERIECWGMRSGIVKVIPPREWCVVSDALPSVEPQLENVRIMSPIEQNFLGGSGRFKQQNIEKRKSMSVREWDEGKGSHPTRRKSHKQVADEKAAKDAEFMINFKPHQDWLPFGMEASDYTPDYCKQLERHYWRNCGMGKSPWYGADTQGSLFTPDTTAWNVSCLPSYLSRLLPSSSQGLPGVNTPYLYFGMWRATFAWHVEDMDLFSINYIHFGAPKFWYAMPQGHADRLETTMRGYFPSEPTQCNQFLRHKSFLVSPKILASSSCRPNTLVQHAGEFVITYPRGYHAGFNLGLNCAESVNFALESWVELGRKARACKCIGDRQVAIARAVRTCH